MDFDQLVYLLDGRAQVDVPCPLCSPYRKKPNQRLKVLRIWRVDEGMVTYCCAHCEASGYMHAEGWRDVDHAEARRKAAVRQQAEQNLVDARILKARTLYENGRPARALGEGYFAARGLDYPEILARQLRINDVWFAGLAQPAKALLMPFRDHVSREIVGVHRIALDQFDERGKRLKKSSGRVSGAAMMLGDRGAVLGICEGLETGVAVTMGDPGIPVWGLSGASVLAGFGPVEGVRVLIIYADHDRKDSKGQRAGHKAAAACRALWREHAEVETVMPRREGTDFADIWRRR